jgi:hypothetical protein
MIPLAAPPLAPAESDVAGCGEFAREARARAVTATLYAAGATLKVTGNGAVSNIGSQYVSNDLTLTGNGNVAITRNGPQLARTRIITLAE